jgi:AraC-like DNA-binding protein
MFHEIIEIVQEEPFGFQKMLSAKTLQMIARLDTVKYFSENEKQYIHEVIIIAKYTIAERLSEEFDFEGFARDHGVSYSWFRQSFKYFTGFSPHQYVLELRMTRAKKLLSETRLSVKQISYDLGFDTPFYFSRIFKKKTGYSPTEWRMCFKGKY